MKLTLFLTPTQLEQIDAFMDADGTCDCGQKMAEDSDAALLAQPHSSKSLQAGNLEIKKLCPDCYERIRDAIQEAA